MSQEAGGRAAAPDLKCCGSLQDRRDVCLADFFAALYKDIKGIWGLHCIVMKLLEILFMSLPKPKKKNKTKTKQRPHRVWHGRVSISGHNGTACETVRLPTQSLCSQRCILPLYYHASRNFGARRHIPCPVTVQDMATQMTAFSAAPHR